jgi:hypothetical protein
VAVLTNPRVSVYNLAERALVAGGAHSIPFQIVNVAVLQAQGSWPPLKVMLASLIDLIKSSIMIIEGIVY